MDQPAARIQNEIDLALNLPGSFQLLENRLPHKIPDDLLSFAHGILPQEQSALRKAAKASVPYYVTLWEAKEKEAKAAVIKGGAKIVEAKDIDRKSFVEVERPVWDKFANTPELKALVQEIANTK